ncbi:MAG TPA: SurA N-terminal domain-containing protein [Candidatus Saccharimonadales bacterium]|nr:SurA N-terminal domain-containing protein [Candidatus Saccharimonadales bacterium]
MKKTSKQSKKSRLKQPKLALNLKRPQVKLKRPFKRGKPAEERVTEALSNVPRITSDTVEEHREEVLSTARKYIYPLQHSKRHVVRNSILILLAVLIAFFVYCGLALYKFQSTSGFLYGVTKVAPFPVAKAGSNWISYESYLFELRRDMHYYQTQQQANFSTKDGKAQLKRLKEQAMSEVVQDAYVKQLAAQHHVSVSQQAVTNEVSLLRSQNRLGNNDHVFKEVLNEFWGWSESDFQRELRQQLLQQAVVAKLDTRTNQRAQAALQQLEGGADFGKLAQQVSDDTATKAGGGQYPNAISVNDRSLSPVLSAELFRLKPGQTSGIINTGYTLEIVKVIDSNGSSLHAAHIQFTYQPITIYTKPLQAKEPVHEYIKV